MKALFATTDLNILKNHKDKIYNNIILEEVLKLTQNKKNSNRSFEKQFSKLGFDKIIQEQ